MDRLKDFKNFLGQESGNLQNYAHDFSHFATQQAWNYADGGPVGETAGIASTNVLNQLMLRCPPTRQIWKPIPQVIHILKGHVGFVNSVAIIPNCKMAISCSSDNTCILWEMNTGEAMNTLKGNFTVNKTFTPDGKRAIGVGRQNTLILLDMDPSEVVSNLTNHHVFAITNDDSKTISFRSDENNQIFLQENIKHSISYLRGLACSYNTIAIAPNGNKAISCSFGPKTVIVWDLNTREPIMSNWESSNAPFSSVAITPDCKRAIYSCGKLCIFWDLINQKSFHLNGHTDTVNAVAITPDGKIAISGSNDKTCKLWNLRTGKVIHTMKGHTEWVTCVAIASDGKRAISGSLDMTCIIWNLNAGNEIQTQQSRKNWIGPVAITPDGKIAISGSGDGTCIVWDLVLVWQSIILKKHTNYVRALAITPDSKKFISGSHDMTCIVWELSTGKPIHTFIGHKGVVCDVAITPNGERLISCLQEIQHVLFGT